MEHAPTPKIDGEPNPVDTTGLCLLSLDGGGVRGLSTLYILKSIMDRLNHARGEAKLPPVKPYEVFDLIGGTSTGGLIAIMLGRLEMDVDACIEAYSDLAAAVFGEKLHSRPVDWKGSTTNRFDSAKLEAAIRKVIEESGGSSQDLFNNGTERGCRTFVCTADRHTKDVVRLRNYKLPHEPNIRATTCQAGLATSAATTFFEPTSIGDRSFADGALGANNPVEEVEGEAINIWCYKTGELKPLVKCFVSIGTGNPGKKPFEDNIAKFLRRTVVQIATETENTEKKFMAKWVKHLIDKRYFRFNVEQGLQEVGLHEYKKKGVIEAATESYLTHTTQKIRVGYCIENLRLKQNKAETSLASIVDEYATRTIRQQPVHRTSWIVPFKRNRSFTGRDAQLEQLERLMSISDRTAKIAVIGLGGVGKTQLVLEQLFQTKEKNCDCTVIWISATSKESLHQGYLDTAQQLGLSGLDDKKNDVKKLVQRYLSDESIGQWVLVFDNADDIDTWVGKSGRGSPTLSDCLPKSNQGAILFTTRDRKLAVKLTQQNLVEVPPMGEDVATRLLGKCLLDPTIDVQQDVSALLSQLTYLPLAIIQAAAYINENGATISEYLSLLAQQEEEVVEFLSRDFDYDGTHGDLKNPVATTWLISFEQIRERDPLAAEYLSFMACLEAKDIPQSLLPPGSTKTEEVDALGTLRAYSFVTMRPREMALDLHRLVHLATRNWLRKSGQLGQWTQNAIVRLEKVFPASDHEYRKLWRAYLTHVRYIMGSDLVDKNWEARRALMRRYAMCLFQDGRWNEAEASFEEVVETQKSVLGYEHPNTLASMNCLASTYLVQGQWNKAEELQKQLIEAQRRIIGDEHPDTLASINNLASIYVHQGRWEKAEQLQKQLIAMCARMLSDNHAITLTFMDNLANTYIHQNRWEEAEKLQKLVVELSMMHLGDKHPVTLDRKNNLSSIYKNQGRWEEAEKLAKLVVEISKRELGEEHHTTMTGMNNLATTYQNQGRWEEAEKLQMQSMEMSKRMLGEEHPDTLASMNNLVSTYMDQGRCEEAEKLLSRQVETCKRVMGEEHPNTLASIDNLTSIYRSLGRLGTAEELQKQVLETSKKILGEEHPNTLSSMNNLALTWKVQSQDDKALRLMEECMQLLTRTLGPGHPLTVASSETLLGWKNN